MKYTFSLSVFAALLLLVGVGCDRTTTESVAEPSIKPTSTIEHTTGDETKQINTTLGRTIDLTSLPLGDGKYSTSPKQGYVYTCQTAFNGRGAFAQGPWIDAAAGTWDLTQKISVNGSVSWPTAYWETALSGETRTITSADLPTYHTTGIFPVATTDDAYNYDRNPNSITAQTIQFSVPKNPTIANSPTCVGGEVGIATTGVLIFNAFDAGGRDAVATEIQDHCEGHPQAGSYYHYHGYSDCFEDSAANDEHSDLLGYAFDGFGIYGLHGEDGVILTSADLDACYGHTHQIVWDGVTTEMYHYHFTQDFPYTVGCFIGTPSVQALSSGEGAGAPAGGEIRVRPNGPPTGGQLLR